MCPVYTPVENGAPERMGLRPVLAALVGTNLRPLPSEGIPVFSCELALIGLGRNLLF